MRELSFRLFLRAVGCFVECRGPTGVIFLDIGVSGDSGEFVEFLSGFCGRFAEAIGR